LSRKDNYDGDKAKEVKNVAYKEQLNNAAHRSYFCTAAFQICIFEQGAQIRQLFQLRRTSAQLRGVRHSSAASGELSNAK
jgi:predicted component of type VI protein secretion system